jgi:hypothetical protein
MEVHRLQVALNEQPEGQHRQLDEQPEEQHRQLDNVHKQVAVPGVLEAAEKQGQGASYQHHVC